MNKLYLLAVLFGLAFIGLVKPASAQTIPNVRGLQPYTAETNFMSLTGFLRWQYYIENGNEWISRAEAASLVRSQTATATAAATE